MSHAIVELTNDNQKIVLMGEPHYKTAEEHRLCEIIKSRFNTIGYEGRNKSSWSSSIVSYVVARLFYRKMKNSSLVDKPTLVNYLDMHHRELLNAVSEVEYIAPNGEVIIISKKDVEDYYKEKISRIHLEQRDTPSIGDNFLDLSLFLSVAALIVPPLGWGMVIFCLYSIFPFFLHNFRVGSYVTRRNLSRFFISGGIIYRRDEIMATELIHQTKLHSSILGIFGIAHLEGVIWHLNNAGFVRQTIYSLNEYVNTRPDE